MRSCSGSPRGSTSESQSRISARRFSGRWSSAPSASSPRGYSPEMSPVLKLLRPGLYVKRWFLVLLVGMVVVSLGIGFALTEAYRSAVAPAWVGFVTLQFLPLLVPGTLFLVLGGAL